jgi:hypothetical protein
MDPGLASRAMRGREREKEDGGERRGEGREGGGIERAYVCKVFPIFL